MKKTFKKISSIILAIAILIMIPVTNGKLRADAHFAITEIGDRTYIIDGYIDHADVTYYIESKWGGAAITIWDRADDEGYAIIYVPEALEGKSVVRLGQCAFADDNSFEGISLPSTLKEIGSYAFQNCTGLKSVTIPDSVETIENGAFSECYNLSEINLGENIKTIYSSSFEGTAYSRNEDNWEDGVLYIGDCLVCADSRKVEGEYNVKEGTRVIAANAFDGCDKLTGINLPDSVKYVNDFAFSLCQNLEYANLNNNVEAFGREVFNHCDKLEKITLGTEKIEYLGDDAFDFEKCGTWIDSGLYVGNVLCKVKPSFSGKFTVKDGTAAIVPYAFEYCDDITEIELPYGIEKIDDAAFYGCDNLERINIPDSVTSIGMSSFGGCTGLKCITIPDSVTSIGDGAFSYCIGLTGITISNGIPALGNNVFSGCTFSNIVIPDSILRIGDSAFENCKNLKKITIPNSVLSVGEAVFKGCSALTDIKMSDNIMQIGSETFRDCSNLTSISLGNKIKVINALAFANCKSLKEFTIPDSVTGIYLGAFAYTGLIRIKIPDSVISIGNEAFSYCKSLTDITIGNGVTSIGQNVFCNTAYFNNPDNWDDGALYIGKYLINFINPVSDSYIIKSGTRTIADCAFAYGSYLTSITIPDSVTNIGWAAFEFCEDLKDIYYTGTQEQWNEINIDEMNENLLNAQIHYAEPAKTYTAKLMVDGKLYKEIEYNEGQKSISLPPVPEKEGYTGTWEPYSLTNGGTTINAIYTPNTYTATLKVDGKVYKEITYTYGQKSITLPEVPKKDGCTGAWESYSLTAGGITINAIYTPIAKGKVKSVSIGNDLELKYKDSAKLNPVIKADSGVKYKVEYKSSDNSIATVDNNGNVYGAKGWAKKTATITCTVTDEYGNQVSDSANVTCGYKWWQWIIGIVLFGWIWY